jgi:hypothetical protein
MEYFSLWDRLFGTYVKKEVTELHYGLDIYPEKEAHSYLPRLLRIPFEKYRAPTGSKFGVVRNESGRIIARQNCYCKNPKINSLTCRRR